MADKNKPDPHLSLSSLWLPASEKSVSIDLIILFVHLDLLVASALPSSNEVFSTD